MTMDAFIQDIVREAGTKIRPMFGVEKAHHHKSESRSDVVTRADLFSEKVMVDRIKKAYPDHGIISEEMGHFNSDADYVWILDPIDGTLNFSTNVPLFGILAALSYKGNSMLAAVYLPITGEMLFAKKGKGARLNGKKIHCSKTTETAKALGCPPGKGNIGHEFLRQLCAETDGTFAGMSMFGCIAANCRFISAGDRDWIVSFAGALHDYAGTSLIMQEAGCVVTGVDGKTWHSKSIGIVAANPILHKKIMRIVRLAQKNVV